MASVISNDNNYSNLTKNELLNKCRELGITKYSTKNKSDLINLLINHDNSVNIDVNVSEINQIVVEEEIQEDIQEDIQEVISDVMASSINDTEIHLSPLIKWSGGKSDEIKKFKSHFPSEYNIYLEPFIGGGSVYFYLNPRNAVITDVHRELIDLYTSIKNGHSNEIYNFMNQNSNLEETYYRVRDQMEINSPLDNAKRFYYLRKTCFRGMLRYNKDGKFNIPYGKYKKINYSDLNNNAYQELLQRTEVINTGFEHVFQHYNDDNNFMFLDPPYDSEFTDYGYCKFGKEEHRRLATLFKETRIKCLMIIGKTDFIEELYRDYIVDEYEKKYKFKIYAGRVGDEINVKHLIIKNYF